MAKTIESKASFPVQKMDEGSVTGMASGLDDRAAWIRLVEKLAAPLLSSLAERRLKTVMPVESSPESTDRLRFTHLEALGRFLYGISPWLELGPDDTAEGLRRGHLASLARQGIDAATDSASPDYMNFTEGRQPVVDGAFFAQSLLRAPNELWKKLEPRVQAQVIAALKVTRPIPTYENNWKLFATTIEVFLQQAGAGCDEERLAEGIRKHAGWYLGDGMYGDGAEFHWDYYNSFVIQPMLVEALDVVGNHEWKEFREQAGQHLTRWAAIQERMISPDGSYPAIGRSIAYRCGAFQGLALAAFRHQLPKGMTPGQARVALTAVIRRTLEASGTFDDQGWLRIGLSGSQPALGEKYISTGSLYLCSAAFLPLGLPATDPFWTDAPGKLSWQKAWSGENLPADQALKKPK